MGRCCFIPGDLGRAVLRRGLEEVRGRAHGHLGGWRLLVLPLAHLQCRCSHRCLVLHGRPDDFSARPTGLPSGGLPGTAARVWADEEEVPQREAGGPAESSPVSPRGRSWGEELVSMEGAREVRDGDSARCHHTECLLATRHCLGWNEGVTAFGLCQSSGRWLLWLTSVDEGGKRQVTKLEWESVSSWFHSLGSWLSTCKHEPLPRFKSQLFQCDSGQVRQVYHLLNEISIGCLVPSKCSVKY